LLEIIDDRLGKGSVLITSQFPVNQWHELVGGATVADALMDRLVHHIGSNSRANPCATHIGDRPPGPPLASKYLRLQNVHSGALDWRTFQE
jgi:hypothetical protein